MKHSEPHPFDAIKLESLQKRQSAKWNVYPADVLPAWVAEMDFPIAGCIRDSITSAIAAEDMGYADPRGLGESFATWADSEWNWKVAPSDVLVVCDVVTGIMLLLPLVSGQGNPVVIDSPVYAPFAGSIRATGRKVVTVPMKRVGDASSAYDLDLDGIESAYAAGARAHILCSPHNPLGAVYSRATLTKLAELADRYNVTIISDEIHAPLTLPGAKHTPLPSVSEAAARRTVVLTSASKTWNIAGLKAALVVATHEATRAITSKLPIDMPYHAGHLGVLGSRAAFLEGAAWRASVLTILDRNRHLLGELLRAHLPVVRYTPPAAGYLAWLDCRDLGLGRDPAKVFLEKGRVALSPGPTFGVAGEGFARLNMATSRELLEEAVKRMARAIV